MASIVSRAVTTVGATVPDRVASRHSARVLDLVDARTLLAPHPHAAPFLLAHVAPVSPDRADETTIWAMREAGESLREGPSS